MVKGIKILNLTKFDCPVVVWSGDEIRLVDNDTLVAHAYITEYQEFTEGVLFEAETGMFGEGRALGGAFVE